MNHIFVSNYKEAQNWLFFVIFGQNFFKNNTPENGGCEKRRKAFRNHP